MSELIRLQKHIADLGICSRRQAEVLIRDGLVILNGKVAEIGQKMDPSKDHLTVDGKKIRPQQAKKEKVVLMMNKPKGLICSNKDPYHAETIFDILPKEFQEMRLFCAGRLDRESEGLLVLTNDGDLANKIMHPSSGIIKRYHVKLHKHFDEALIPKIIQGVTREGELLYAKKLIMASHGPDSDRRLEVHLEQGRKREIRRLFEAFGYYVKKLERFQIGRLVLKKVPQGRVKLLKKAELDSLFKN